MDKWMVAIAAGAGSIAQHFKKFKQPGEHITSVHGSFNDKPESPKQPNDKKWPFRRLKQDGSEVTVEVSRGVYGAKAAAASEFDEGKYEGSDGILVDVERGDLVNEASTPRSRMSFRSRKVNRRTVRPLSSLESCVMAHVEMKEYPSSSFASPSMMTVRPFFVTDGSNVINRVSVDANVVQNGYVVKKQQSCSEEKNRSLDATLLVCLGMSFGILYSFIENKREVEKLNRLLKQKENLVQDLEEEIEMKDSLIMRELTLDDHKSRVLDGGSFDGESPRSVSHEHDNKDHVIIQEKHNSFSKIEAELEAELEMLELSMTSSNLERKISNLAELDPDFEAGVAEGELRGERLDDANEEDERGSTTTTHSAYYAVSPRELSLRLHEVLQSQLEERIRELEAQIKVQNHKCWNDYSSSNAGDENHEDEPVVLNLSGEALEAYNEACNEFAKFDESDEDFDYDGDNGTPQNGGDEQDFDDDDDEMEKLLIKHIVEKARQGSPAVLNAQKAFFSE
ncbi:putative protein polar localization during asymmetric division and redistribution [Helianthus annuus]|uniref:Uncharacterized protein n=1 Tax=Helianthus annuus TaxID=4232 RepID=A0A251TZV1_HELAN|nr:uncharacterized protein LOC110879647 [Helianthus annuus]XP_035833779.1 uncharacterized protein LOC110879647 [Helianthus annuus]KAF5792647.1 putative protein polar localization during asymmetric division and redistribution [Helianthus annuus]KAJ0527572.1 putative protein POLAR [Helianthus annuus]KAJ0543980.1 putative protein POLAR [Helianthus annuus]KAJ0709036.1 putative protein POLAR [Helianthus annuus]